MRIRRDLHPGLFTLVLLFEFASAHIDMLAIISLNIPSYIYAFFWVPFSILTSVTLTGVDFWQYYFIVDNLTLLGLLSVISVCFVNDSLILYWVGYAIFVFLNNRHFRIILNAMKWSRPKVVIYKLIKIWVVAFFFLDKILIIQFDYVFSYGQMSSGGSNLSNYAIAQLIACGMFVVFTIIYRSYFVFAISYQDGTLNAEWNYQIREGDDVSGQMEANKTKVELTMA